MDSKELLASLKGLPQEVVDKIIANAKAQADTALAKIQAQAKLDEQKTAITEALKPAIAEIKVDFDVKVRAGVVEVHLVGVGGRTGGGTGTNPNNKFRIRDTGMTMKEITAKYTPEKMDEFNAQDVTTGTGRGVQYKLAQAAAKIKAEQEKPA